MINFESLAKKIKSLAKRELVILWSFALAVGFALIILQNKNKLPLGKGDFIFLALITLLVALYRPRWIFFLFISSLVFENITLADGFLSVHLRPYQFLGAILTTAVAILFLFKKLQFRFIKPTWIDWLLFSLAPLSFLALLNSPDKAVSFKQNLVIFSFLVLYYLTRNFIQTRNDLTKTAFFFIGSFLIVAFYGVYQIFADKFGWESFEVMPGRLNSVFVEPDWLGIYLDFALAVFLALTFYFAHNKQKTIAFSKYILLSLNLLIFLDLTLLLLALSRSAWMGVITIFFFYLLFLLPNIQKSMIADLCNKKWRLFFREGLTILLIFFASLIFIQTGKLSRFDIFDRLRSTATSEQKITVACDSPNIPASIKDVGELEKYNCRHINLEEINYYKSQGKIVVETYRRDPNVLTREAIYRKSFETIKRHPILGVGFGTITRELGVDQHGAGLNESNILLQVWAGSGIIGLAAFVTAVGYLFVYGFRRTSPVCFLNKIIDCPAVKDNYERAVNVFAVLGTAALIIPNLFNAGLFMGIFWLGLALAVSAKNICSNSF